MSTKQITLLQTWNQDLKSKSCTASSKFNNKQRIVSDKSRGKQTALIKKNEEANAESLWKQNISILQQGPSTSNDCYNFQHIPDFDMDAGKTWLYPTNYPLREYQFSIVQKAMFYNTLVVLPTGLGKTFIAAVVMYNLYRWYPRGKIVFMAPTRPLVAQQVDACFRVMGIPQDDTVQMTGTMNPEERKRTWKRKRVFFLTPQILANDLVRNICLPKSIKCLVVDEAHKALGNHAYCQVVRDLYSQNMQFRLLALTATPGSDTQAVKQIIENLLISHVELRTEDSDDIKPYTYERNIEKIVIPLGEDLSCLKSRLLDIINIYLKRLSQKSGLALRNPASLSQFHMYKLREEFNKKPPGNIPHQNRGLILADFALCISLYHAYELMLLHGIKPFYYFVKGVINGEKGIPYARAELQKNLEFEQMLQYVREKYALESSDSSKIAHCDFEDKGDNFSNFIPGHPKLIKLKELVLKHFQSSMSGEGTRVMIFSQYRDSVREITEMLKGHEPLIRVMSFIGQSSTSASKAGVSQKQQLKIVKDFREGGYNTLVSTCVGEEGLDIGEVDLIVCYDAPKSPIRLVQRMGRTGRQRQGKIVVLLAEGKEEQMYNTSQYKKKNVFRSIKNGFSDVQLFPNNPLMVPFGHKPVCVKKFMEIEPKKSLVAKRELNRRKRLYPFLNDEEVLRLDRFNIKTNNSPCILSKPQMLSLLNKTQLAKVIDDEIFNENPSSETPILSINKYMPWQDTLQPTYLISHSRKTVSLVRAIQSIGGVLVLDKGTSSYHCKFNNITHSSTSIKNGSSFIDLQNKGTALGCSKTGVYTCDGQISSTDGNLSPCEISIVAVAQNKHQSKCGKQLNEISSYVTDDSGDFIMHTANSTLVPNTSISDLFDSKTSCNNIKKLERNNSRKVSVNLPPESCDTYHFDEKILMAIDIKGIIGNISKSSLIMSKIGANLFTEDTCDLLFDDSQLDDADFLDFIEFDLNFHCESPVDLVSSTPKQNKLARFNKTRGDKDNIPAKSDNPILEISVANVKKQICNSAFEEPHFSVSGKLSNDKSSSPSKMVFENTNFCNKKSFSDPLKLPSIAPLINEVNCCNQFSLTQLVSLVDYSDSFTHVLEKDVHKNSSVTNPVSDVQDNLWQEFEQESDDEVICPTPPLVSKTSRSSRLQQIGKNLQSSNFSGSKLFSQSLSSPSKLIMEDKPVTSVTKIDNLQHIDDKYCKSSDCGSKAFRFSPVTNKVLCSRDGAKKSVMSDYPIYCEGNDECLFFDVTFDSHFQKKESVSPLSVGGNVNTMNNFYQKNISCLMKTNSSQSCSPKCKCQITSITEKFNKQNEASKVKNIDFYTLGNEKSLQLDASKSSFTKLQKKFFTKDSPLHEDVYRKEQSRPSNLLSLNQVNGSELGFHATPLKEKGNSSESKEYRLNSTKHIPSVAERTGVSSENDKCITDADLIGGSSRQFMGKSSKSLLSSDFHDFKIPKRLKKDYIDTSFATSSGLLQGRKKMKGFIIDEADVSNMNLSDIDSEGTDLDRFEASFIDDSHDIISDDQHGVYLQSVKNCIGVAQKFKLSSNHNMKRNMDLQHNAESETSDYVIDSFVVRNDEVEFNSSDDPVMEYKKQSRVKKKRKRIIRPACSSSSEDDSNVEHSLKVTNCLKKNENKCVYSNVNSCEKFTFVASEPNVLKEDLICVTPNLDNIKRKVRHVQENAIFVKQSKSNSPGKITFDVSWTTTPDNLTIPESTKEKSMFQPLAATSVPLKSESTFGNISKSVPCENTVVIIVDSKELSGGKSVINTLRNQFKANTVIMQLFSVNYIVSKELAVERILDTEFSASLLHSKGAEKVRSMCQLYDRCCVIIEKDERKQNLSLKNRCKHLDFSLVLLASSSVQILHSESPENTAFLLLELAQQEKKRNLGIDITFTLESKKKQLFDFFACFSLISSSCALNFVNAFTSLEEFLRSSPGDLKVYGHISQHRAQRIYNFFNVAVKI